MRLRKDLIWSDLTVSGPTIYMGFDTGLTLIASYKLFRYACSTRVVPHQLQPFCRNGERDGGTENDTKYHNTDILQCFTEDTHEWNQHMTARNQ